ncbi:Nephrocystin-3 [Durusdinium trenchii]|uniref:Nephrocystin-3 n=1 Tax=Durusdinium trenchii TaxID=1381693 RepID=A0ABP0IKZ5_9DINO
MWKVFKACAPKHHGPKLIEYRGVNLVFLIQVKEDLVSGKLCSDVELVWLEDGSTAQVLSKRDDAWSVSVAYVGTKEVAPHLTTPKPFAEWDTEDVCQFFVERDADVLEQRRAYVEIHKNKPWVGARFSGEFVSQARRTRFVDLVSALEANVKLSGKSPAKSFVWIDLFGVNQKHAMHTGQGDSSHSDKEEEILSNGLHNAIRRFGQFVVFFDSWESPAVLKRAWCVFELYGASLSKQKVNVMLPSSEEKEFLGALRNDFERISAVLGQVNSAEAACFVAEDKAMIDQAIQRNVVGGHATIDAGVTSALRVWFVKVIRTQLELSRAEGKTSAVQELLYTGAVLQFEQGQFAEAQAFSDELLESLPDDSVQRGLILNLLGNIARTQGQYTKAEELFEQALARKEQDFGATSDQVARTLNNLGDVALRNGDLDKAEQSLERAMEIFVSLGQSESATSSRCLTNLAAVHMERGDIQSALGELQRSLEMKKQFLGAGHPSVAFTLNMMGRAHRLLGNLDESITAHREAVTLFGKVRGPMSLERADALEALGVAQMERAANKEALESFEDALEIYRQVHKGGSKVARALVQVAEAAVATGNTDDRDRAKEATWELKEMLRQNPDLELSRDKADAVAALDLELMSNLAYNGLMGGERIEDVPSLELNSNPLYTPSIELMSNAFMPDVMDPPPEMQILSDPPPMMQMLSDPADADKED